MKVTFKGSRVYGGGIGLKSDGDTADVTKAQAEQFKAQGFIHDDVRKQKETQTAKPATTSKED